MDSADDDYCPDDAYNPDADDDYIEPLTERCDVSTVTINGESLQYVDITDEDSMIPGRPPVVLLPDTTDSWKAYSPLLEELGTSQRIVALSLRGFGDSAKTGSYSIEGYIADVVGLLDALEIDAAVLGGHGFGGLVAALVAARHPARVASLLLIGTGGLSINSEPARLSYDSKSVRADYKDKVDAVFLTEALTEIAKADSAAHNLLSTELCKEPMLSELAAVTTPVLILSGGKDVIFNRESQCRLFSALCAAPRIVFCEVAEAPHRLLWTHPEDVANHITAFLISPY